MSETACLHIQYESAGPVRIVELAWPSVRIGRALFCEVRLQHADVPEQSCRLQRRGPDWFLIPFGPSSSVIVQQLAVDEPMLIPFNTTFCIGPVTLTLRRTQRTTVDLDGGRFRERSVSTDILQRTAYSASGTQFVENHRTESQPRTPASPPRQYLSALPERVVPATRQEADSTSDNPWKARWNAVGAYLRTADQHAGHSQLGVAESLRSSAKRPDGPKLNVPQAGLSRDWIPAAPKLIPTQTIAPEPLRKQTTTPTPLPVPTPTSHLPLKEKSCPALAPPRARVEAPRDFHWPLPQVPIFQEPVPLSVRPTDEDTQNARVESSVIEATPPIEDVSTFAPQVKTGADCEEINDPTSQQEACAEVPRLEESGEQLETAFLDETSPEPVDTASESTGAVMPSLGSTVVEEIPPCKNINTYEESSSYFMHQVYADDQVHRTSHITATELEAWLGGQATMGALPHEAAQGYHPFTGQDRTYADDRNADLRLPSVRDILAAAPVLHRTPHAQNRYHVQPCEEGPTPSAGPHVWRPPFWLVWLPAILTVLSTGILAVTLTVLWANDSLNASQVVHYLIPHGNVASKEKRLPPSVQPSRLSWWATNAIHLALWGIYLDRSSSMEPEADAGLPLLNAAVQISPVNSMARLARAQTRSTASPASNLADHLGLSRDVVCLTWSAHALRLAGKKPIALRLYRQALELNASSLPEYHVTTSVHELSSSQRYALPGERSAQAVIQEMSTAAGWNYQDWSEAVPENSVAMLSCARLLQDKGRDEARTVLDRIITTAEKEEPRPAPLAQREAILAEAFALLSRWEDAKQHYLVAVQRVEDTTMKRMWWCNLASIAHKANDEEMKRLALQSAKETLGSDRISQRAYELERILGFTGSRKRSGTKAN